MTDETTREIVERCRRIETRLTKFLESQGFDTHVKRPFWNGKAVVIPSLGCSVQDMLSAIPADHREDGVPVVNQGVVVMFIYPEDD